MTAQQAIRRMDAINRELLRMRRARIADHFFNFLFDVGSRVFGIGSTLQGIAERHDDREEAKIDRLVTELQKLESNFRDSVPSRRNVKFMGDLLR